MSSFFWRCLNYFRGEWHLLKSKPLKSGLYSTCILPIFAIVFVFCFTVTMICVYNVIRHSSQKSPVWNASDYQSNSDYYNHLVSVRDFTLADNLRLDHLWSPQLHPNNGKSVVYLRQQYHMPDLKGYSTTLHWVDLETNKTIQLTRPIWGIDDQQFFWIESTTILFLSNRASSGLTQLFQLNLPNDISSIGSFLDPIQITDYPLHIENLLVNRQATRLAFSCQVYVNLSIQQTAALQAAEKARGSLVYKFDKLFIRHWDEYILGPRHHPFIVSIKHDAKGIFTFTSTPVDILFGVDSDSPTRPFGQGRTEWSFSASGDRFAYTRQYDETSEVAWSLNSDIFTVDLNSTHLRFESVCITCENLTADTNPSYSPIDDQVLVYLSQPVSDYHVNQFKIKWFNGSNPKTTLLNDWDRSIKAVTWSLDGQSLFLELGEQARYVIYKLSKMVSSNSSPVRLISTGSSHDVNIHPTDNNIFVFTHDSITEPANIYLYSSPTSIQPVTNHNENLMTKVRISTQVEIFNFTGAHNETVSGWHVKPAGNTNQKVPFIFIIHGGPQVSLYDKWSYQLSFQTFASQGYAIIAINFHGSDSYGQNFTDSINNHLNSWPYEDLRLGLRAALDRYTYIDRNRGVAFGFSYGGYMINWIAGHPEMSQHFRTLICFAGIFDVRGMAYSTDKLWINEHGTNNWTSFEKFNPVDHIVNWSKPMLIIHGSRDYRVPDTQGISAFAALQRRGIPSRMLYFPDEIHGIRNRLNLLVWYHEVFDWMNKWTT